MSSKVYEFIFELEPVSNLHCQAFKGSMLRGLLGWSLKKIACVNTNRDCLVCPVKAKCPYYICFDGAGLYKNGPRDVSHPFVINCLDNRTMISAGDKLIFELLLMGESLKYLNYFVYAFVNGGHEYGLGNGKVKFSVNAVSNKGNAIMGDDGCLQNLEKIQAQSLRKINSENCYLRFISPTRLKCNGRYCGTDLDSEGLVKGVYHSLEGLKPWFDDMDLPEKGAFLSLHKKLQVENISLRWNPVKRYSNRQQAKLSMGGVLGRIKLSGDALSELKPWLSLLELTNIGKNRVFGFGRFCVENFFVNISNHSLSGWSEKQIDAARKNASELLDLPFPLVKPQATTEELENEADELLKKLPENTTHAMVMGEFILTFIIVKKLQKRGVVCLAATTERRTVIKGEVKTSIFEFVGFRQYPN